jgi:CRISPR-associated endonuclease/helicase Cas3
MNRPPPFSDEMVLFRKEFSAVQGDDPFPWQERLFKEFCCGKLPPALDLPTGLGKTSLIAIWYLALKAKAPVSRRLVYVVDRRAVVDQATSVAETIRKKSSDASLRLSTLRGQYLDNREWLADPAGSAIIVGTVDMIGSRLLFSGYSVSTKMRPYHAGLLGADTLIVLDEAHLVPPFEELLKVIARDFTKEFGPRAEDAQKIVPPFRLMSLSATGREDKDVDSGKVFQLMDDDYQNDIVKRRLDAQKRLILVESKTPVVELVNRAWALGTEPKPARVLVYCNSREDALKVKEEIDKCAKKEKIEVPSGLLVGERRVREREKLLGWLKEYGFVGDPKRVPQAPTFLIATSAGEVGVDLDADHMVCDLVEWERMVQRLGRVNRRGGDDRVAIVDVIFDVSQMPPEPNKPNEPQRPEKGASAQTKKKYDKECENYQKQYIEYLKDKAEHDRFEARKKVLRTLPSLDDGRFDASPGAIVKLKNDPTLKELFENAQTQPPLRPALTRALIDAWSMTSLDEHTGRPDIQPWLRGWVKDAPQTTIIWRKYLPARIRGADATNREANDFFEAAPPDMSEMLEAEIWRVTEWLVTRAAEIAKNLAAASSVLTKASPVLLIFDHKDELQGSPWTIGKLAELENKEKKRNREAFSASQIGRTLVVSSLLAGLNGDGMLDVKFDSEPSTIDDDETWQPESPFRVRETTERVAVAEKGWRESHRFVSEQIEDGEAIRWFVVEQRRGQAQSEEGRAITRVPQLLTQHQSRVAQILADWTRELKLPEPYPKVLTIAGRLHDEGKKARRWQRAFNAPDGAVYAKTMGPINQRLLDGYRHEFGSLPYVEDDAEFKALPSNLQDFALHLVAGHHGGARPLISTRSCEDAPPSALEARAREVALRFARLQKRWGPWGLAWWEALLRAADQRASSETDTRVDEKDGSSKPGEEA